MAVICSDLYRENVFTPVLPETGNLIQNTMIKTKKVSTILTIIAAIILLIPFGGCKMNAIDQTTSYNLMAKDVLGVSGTAVFTESGSNTTIVITLNGAPSGTHPAELCMNTAAEGGAVVLSLNPVDASGKSSTSVSSMTYAQLIAYDGFIRVSKSSTEPDVIMAQGDIGGNVITATKISYLLETIGSYGVSGTALFEKRVNGNTLVTISITGGITGDQYPATINLGSIESVGGGPVVKELNNVDGTTGKSYTNIKKLDNGVAITYDNWLVYDGYINIYQSSLIIDNIICHGNIGSN
jgi:hypothetical protein